MPIRAVAFVVFGSLASFGCALVVAGGLYALGLSSDWSGLAGGVSFGVLALWLDGLRARW